MVFLKINRERWVETERETSALLGSKKTRHVDQNGEVQAKAEHQRSLSAFKLKGSSIIQNREDQSARNESEQGETSSTQQSQKKSKKLKPSTL